MGWPRSTRSSWSLTSLALVSVLGLRCACGTSAAQAAPAAPLDPGTLVRVLAYPRVGTPTTGRVLALRSDTLVVRLDRYDAPTLTLPLSGFISLERAVGTTPGSRVHGAVVGACVGGAAGIVLGLALSPGFGSREAVPGGASDSQLAAGVLVVSAFGLGLAGAALGAVLSPGVQVTWEKVPTGQPQGRLELGIHRGGPALAWQTRF